MDGYSEDALRGVIADYESRKAAALAERDAQLQAFHAAGWRPVDLQRVTGYSRETVRQALNTQVRRAVNRSRRKMPSIDSRPPADYVRFADRKPYVVAEALEALRGPTEGTATLPHHLDWSGRPTYDLNRPARLASMYKIVLSEANTVGDLNAWLNADVLTRVWPTLWLPAQLRQIWERKFPGLAQARDAAA